MTQGGTTPAVGFGYRRLIDRWTRDNLHHFDVIEVTVDHCLLSGETTRTGIYDLVGRVPLTAHGIGLSIGTDVPVDLAYLDQVAEVVERLRAPAYSEHLAFTRVPGRDLGNLLPLPRTRAVAATLIDKIRLVQSRVPVPFLLENIAHVFEWPESDLSEAEFIGHICRESGAGILLDVENLYLNWLNHRLDPYAYIDALPPGAVREIHIAGGETVHEEFLERDFLADTHSHPVPAGVFELLDYALRSQAPATIVLERDDRLDVLGEILPDIERIRAHLRTNQERIRGERAVGAAE